MNVFEVVKENVTARQAAEAYGLKVGRTGMACCPFHSDKSPSMKLDERYYCFGCGVTGDAVGSHSEAIRYRAEGSCCQTC